jgi:predicted nucleic acid-binding protein
MRNLLIDTNIYTHALKGDGEVISILQRAGSIGICTISIGELLGGFKGGRKEKQNREELEEFLDSPRVFAYSVDEDSAEYYAEILDTLRKLGKPIPTNDIWIAAIAFQHGLRLLSKDKHFKHIPGLVLASL